MTHPDPRRTPRPPRTGLLTALALAAVGPLASTGCARHHNERLMLGNAVRTATFRTPQPASPPTATPHRTSEHTADPDRSGWPAQVFLVPVDGTVHGPVRHRPITRTQATRRQEGLFPTAESALDLEGDTGPRQALEGVIAPFAAAAELAWMPVSLILEPPTKNAQSPASLHKRTARHAWSSAPIAEPDE